jgi:oligopeptide/dipeptide ABC transporter ATP-binding protein
MLESTVKKILKIKNLRKEFHSASSKRPIVAVDDISISIEEGKTLGIVGESGSGKSTLGRLALRLIEPTSGSVEFDGVNILQTKPAELRKMRSQMQIIFQDPMSSLNPRMSVRALIGEPLEIHKVGNAQERKAAIENIAQKVGISIDALDKYPHEFSGGQRQRISIARAVINNPRLIVADEPVSALDVSIQSQILNLLMDLRNELNLTFVFISHDLSVVRHISDHVAVMYLGNIVESGPTEDLFSNPQHPYTKALISAIPQVQSSAKTERIILRGDIPNPADAPSGCHFHPRCPVAIEKCSTVVPFLQNVGLDHEASCHLLDLVTSNSRGESK